jgi:hypothetical protein
MNELKGQFACTFCGKDTPHEHMIDRKGYIHDPIKARLTGKRLRDICYRTCGLDPTWIDARWDILANAILMELVDVTCENCGSFLGKNNKV